MKIGEHKTGTYSVRLKVLRGKKTYDEHGKINSFSQELDAPMYPSFEWDKFISNVSQLYTGVEVVSVKEIIKTVKQNPKLPVGEVLVTVTLNDEVNDEIKEAINKDVNGIFATPEKVMTPQEKEIAELKAMVEQLAKDSKKKDVKSTDTEEDIDALRTKYITLTGKEPDGRWKEPKLIEEIEKAAK